MLGAQPRTQPDVWRRLAALEFDVPGASLPFTTRLARDNGWTEEFAKRAIEEYGSSDSGASLGDILGAALGEAAKKDEK